MALWKQHADTAIFVTKDSKQVELNKLTNIILSPEYYWIKRTTIPVKQGYKAKRYAPSVMEDFIPYDREYEYEVFKTDKAQEFIIIAYDKKEILKLLKEKFHDTKNINSIYWAQTLFDDIKECIKIDKKHALINIDGIALFAPQDCSNKKLNLKKLFKSKQPKHSFDMHRFTSYNIPKKFVKSLLLIWGLFFIALVSDLAVHRYKILQLEDKMQELREEHNLPKTSFEFDSIKNRLKKIYIKQKSNRELMHIVQNLPLKEGTYIKSLSMDKQKLTLKIKLKNKIEQKRIDRYLQKRTKIEDKNLKNLIYEVTISDD